MDRETGTPMSQMMKFVVMLSLWELELFCMVKEESGDLKQYQGLNLAIIAAVMHLSLLCIYMTLKTTRSCGF